MSSFGPILAHNLTAPVQSSGQRQPGWPMLGQRALRGPSWSPRPWCVRWCDWQQLIDGFRAARLAAREPRYQGDGARQGVQRQRSNGGDEASVASDDGKGALQYYDYKGGEA
jgi:hypothetical protein